MKKLTNHQAGARGVNLTGGRTIWIEPGQTVEIDPKEIVGEVPDLGKASGSDAVDADLAAENAALKQQVADVTKERDALAAENAALKKAPAAPDNELIKAAVEGLDPKNDKHWTQAGLPEVAAVKEALGADVTRADIEAAAPGAKRPAEA